MEKLLLIKSFSKVAPERSRAEIINSAAYKMLLTDIEQMDWLVHSAKVAVKIALLSEKPKKSPQWVIGILKNQQCCSESLDDSILNNK